MKSSTFTSRVLEQHRNAEESLKMMAEWDKQRIASKQSRQLPASAAI